MAPQTSATNQCIRARKVMADKFGKSAIKGKLVHHKDGDPWNNDPSNLMVVDNQAKHKELHREMIANGIVSKKNYNIILRNIPEDTRRKLKAKAALLGESMQSIILKLIEKYIASK